MIEALQESNIDRASSLLREIENDSASSVILAKQAKEKREVLANQKDENIKEEKVKEENKNEEKPKVEEPKKESVITGQKAEYITKLNSIEESLKKLDYLYENGITTEMKEGEGKRYEAWDKALNEIYGVLKMQLPTSEMNTLREKQREWITYRDQKAEEAWNESGQGTLSGLASTSSNVSSTKERCYQLVEQYMK
ncbi:lysozyme inhibitor LprI family protein [Bacillus sp. NPDC057893]|uniref:lysozyme inhibitor LprI family protein n=1 Tax=Bacillus sp. NPDC057893 TaxID=3346273 RepID=UPI0036726F81